jgi:transcriptional regulator with XRE-family HTH domain
MADLRQVLGTNVRFHRDLLGMTQAETAQRADMTLNYLGYIERGLKWPSPEKLQGLAETLQTTPADLLKLSSLEHDRTIEIFRERIKSAVDEISATFLRK